MGNIFAISKMMFHDTYENNIIGKLPQPFNKFFSS